MSTFRNPVGPQSSRVYWRRRLIVGLGLLAVIIIVILIVAQPRGGGTPASTKTPGSSSTPTGTPSAESTNPSDAVACDPAKVTVEAVTDNTSYEAGQNPQLSFVLKSTATTPCTIPAGSDVQEFRITSGEELIWSSKDCQTDAVAAIAVLKPGVPTQVGPITWDRTRSSTDTCDVARDPVDAGGASYHLGIIVGDLESKETKQFLLF